MIRESHRLLHFAGDLCQALVVGLEAPHALHVQRQAVVQRRQLVLLLDAGYHHRGRRPRAPSRCPGGRTRVRRPARLP